MTVDEIKRNVRAAVAGMNHDQRETLGIALCEAASGESVELLRCDRGTMRLWTETKSQAAAEKDRLLALAMKGRLDAAGQERLLALLGQEDGAKSRRSEHGTLTLTQEEKDKVRRLGFDPEQIIAQPESETFTEWMARRGGAA